MAGILNLVYKRDIVIQKRTAQYFGEGFEEQDSQQQKDNKKRSIFNNQNRFKTLLDKKMTKAKKRDLENRLREAGYPLNMSPIDFRFLQIVIGFFIFTCIFLLFSWA